jgi:hypothetical protein
MSIRNGHGSKLPRKGEQAISALLSFPTIEEAAAAVSIAPVTLRRWLKEDGFRTAYLAAANRAQYAIQHYPQAPAVEEAMVILKQAYDAPGMKELSDSAMRVLEKNFPNSRYLKGVKKQVPWWRLWDPDW